MTYLIPGIIYACLTLVGARTIIKGKRIPSELSRFSVWLGVTFALTSIGQDFARAALRSGWSMQIAVHTVKSEWLEVFVISAIIGGGSYLDKATLFL